MGQLLRRLRRQYEEAIVKYQQALDLDPNYALVYNNWGWSLAGLGRHEEAIAKYQQALKLDPNFAKAYLNWGWSLRNLGRHEEAIAKYQQALDLDPNYAKAYNSLGYLYLLRQNFSKAIVYLEKAVSLALEDYNVPINLGIAYYQLKNIPQAKIQFTAALEKCPASTPDGCLNKITALLGLARVEEATHQLRQTVEQFSITTAFSKDYFTDWEMLATSPQPPQGIHEFLEEAKKLIT